MAFLDYSGLSHFLDKIKTIFVPVSDKGANNGVATLNSTGKVPSSQLSTMTGASSGAAGSAGLVPAPSAGDEAKALLGNGTWGTVTTSDMTGATDQTAGTHGLVPAPAAGDQAKYLKGDGSWGAVDLSSKVDKQQAVADAGKVLGINNSGVVTPVDYEGNDFTGATSSAAGSHGLVPAPSAGDQGKVLYGGGGWDVAPGARVIQVETTVTNTSGSYTNTVSDDRVSADMKPLSLEIANPDIFNDKITVTCGNGTVTIACNNVAGSSTVKINVIKAALNTSAITSEEFDILNAGKVDKNQGSVNAGKLLCVNSSGQVSLRDDEGSRFVVVPLDSVSNVSGSYTHTTTVAGMTNDLKAALIEASDPTIFKAPVSIVTGTNTVTLSCSSVEGESTVKVSFLAVGNANPLNSTEYGALDTRIGSLSDLTTTNKTSIVNAINEQVSTVGDVPSGKTVQGQIDALSSKIIYSTNEQIIGTWITGDTLYRRVIPNLSIANGDNYDLTAANIKEMIGIGGFAIRSSDDTLFPLNSSDVSGTKAIALYKKSSKWIDFWTSTGTWNVTLILTYTKI